MISSGQLIIPLPKSCRKGKGITARRIKIKIEQICKGMLRMPVVLQDFRKCSQSGTFTTCKYKQFLSMMKQWIKSIWSFRKQLFTLYYAFRDPRTPWFAKLTAISALLYFVSPIDLIPDIIPVAGFVDDLVIVPALISLAIGMLPPEVKASASQKTIINSKRFKWAAVLIIAFVVTGLILLYCSSSIPSIG